MATNLDTTAGAAYRVICDYCGNRHAAEYSHEGKFGEGRIYAVVCPEESRSVVDYYTAAALV